MHVKADKGPSFRKPLIQPSAVSLWPAGLALLRRPQPACPPSLHRSISNIQNLKQVLALDHNQLGSVGLRVLSQGLKRCLTLQHLSLEDCGIGPAGAEALAESMQPDPKPEIAALQPKYLALNLSRNPLGGAGLDALCEGLVHCQSLRILNLAATELGSEDVPALRMLSVVLEARSTIEQVGAAKREVLGQRERAREGARGAESRACGRAGWMLSGRGSWGGSPAAR